MHALARRGAAAGIMRKFSSQVTSKLGLNRDKNKVQQEGEEDSASQQGAGVPGQPSHPLKARPHARAYGRGHRHHAFVPLHVWIHKALAWSGPCRVTLNLEA
eukprot:scaffold7919_cov27-Tisochrysis_lutea.AAC.1